MVSSSNREREPKYKQWTILVLDGVMRLWEEICYLEGNKCCNVDGERNSERYDKTF